MYKSRTWLLLSLLALVAAPAHAQIDLSGEWSNIAHEDAQDRRGGPDMGDFTGFPINDAARLRAESWVAEILSVPEWQCRPHPADYITSGPSTLRIWREETPINRQVVAWHMEWLRSRDRPIYMDGRPHPPAEAPHTWGGFSTGKWDGDMFTITTTHLKEGYLRRNGIPRSDLATVTEHIIRHGNYLEWVTIINDPVYFTEPVIRTTEYVLNMRASVSPNPCSAIDVGEEVIRPKGWVPHYLPGTNPNLTEFLAVKGVPAEGARGGPDTIYPEYRSRLAGRSAPAAAPRRDVQPNRNPHDQNPASSQIQIRPVRGNVYLLVGAGSNLTLLMGPDNVLLVDTGAGQMSESVLQAIRQFTDKSIRYIVNTSAHQGHTGGNEKIAQAGSTITGGTVFADANEIAAVIAHENVLHAMIDAPADALPSVTFNTADKKLSPSFHNEGVHIIHMPSAVTDGDSIVHFRGSDVISAGDIFLTTSYPFIDIEKGGGYQGIIDALNGILDLAIPDYWMEGGTMIIPGHGRISDSADVGYYRDMLTIIRDRVQNMIKKGMTLNQAIAARPTLDYDPRYGSDTGSWTTDMFVEAVYRSLNK